MKTIDLESLIQDGYQEDTRSIRSFERRYAPFSILGVIGFAGGFYLIYNNGPTIGIAVAAVSFLFLGAVCTHAYFAIPVSTTSGLPMEKYRRIGSMPNETEFIYVDHSSRTFCRRVAVIKGT